MIPYGIFSVVVIVAHTYLVICRAIGKEKISTAFALVSYIVINPVAFVFCFWILELGVNSFFYAVIFQLI